jgi:hypothetical protein
VVGLSQEALKLGFRNWRRKSLDRDQWRAIVRDHGSTRAAAPIVEKEENIALNINLSMLSIIMQIYAIQ